MESPLKIRPRPTCAERGLCREDGRVIWSCYSAVPGVTNHLIVPNFVWLVMSLVT